MYYNLRGAMKRRLILELQDAFSRHPVYSKIVVQDRYSFDEREQYAIVVKGSGMSKIGLSGDNFIGTVESFVGLGNIPNGPPCFPIEWVREDARVVQNNNNVVPTPPGVYFLEVESAPERVQEPGSFIIDPLIRVEDEVVLQCVSGVEDQAVLEFLPAKPEFLRLYENGRTILLPGRDYSVSGKNITFKTRFYPGFTIFADYYYSVDRLGPFPFYWNQADRSALPGCVLAFGKRARTGDRVAVVVTPDRVDTAQAYGGKFELSFDLDVIARDTSQLEEIADLAVMYLWGEKRSTLADAGIDISDVSSGSEGEDSYDENGGDPYYTASLSVTLTVDWEIHVPLPLTIAKVTASSDAASLNPDRFAVDTSLVRITANHPLLASGGPILAGRNNQGERIH